MRSSTRRARSRRETDSSILPAIQQALRTLEWVGRHENLAVCGPSGTGKTHLVEALAHGVGIGMLPAGQDATSSLPPRSVRGC